MPGGKEKRSLSIINIGGDRTDTLYNGSLRTSYCKKKYSKSCSSSALGETAIIVSYLPDLSEASQDFTQSQNLLLDLKHDASEHRKHLKSKQIVYMKDIVTKQTIID